MNHTTAIRRTLITATLVAAGVAGVASVPASAQGGSTPATTTTTKPAPVDTIKVSKCYVNSGGEMLLKAASSDPNAQLFAYRPDGSLIGQVQNGGGSRYGGTVMPYQSYDPLFVTFRSTSGGSITVATGPFQI